MNRNKIVEVIACWSVVSLVGCGQVAHSLGGDPLRERINGGGGADAGTAQVQSGGAPDVQTSNGDGGPGSGVSAAGASSTPASNTPASSAPTGCNVYDDAGNNGCAGISVMYRGAPYSFRGCCLPDGKTCGMDIGFAADWLRGRSPTTSVTVQGGCQPYDQVGVPDTSCTAVGALSPDFAGCCRSDGTCGADLSLLNVGCVQEIETPASDEVIAGDAGPGIPDPPPPAPLPPRSCNYHAP